MRRLPIQSAPLVQGDGHSIKPVDPGADFEREAARIERLTADRELVDRVMLEGYAGPTWERFRRALAEYGLAVLCAWIRSGRIFVECKTKGFGAISRRKAEDVHGAESLAGETVAVSLRFFREQVLIPGRWDVTRGASLSTYFIGACVRHFPNVYLRADGHALTEHLQEDVTVLETLADRAAFSRPDRRVELASAIDSMEDEILREILLDEAEGYTQDETASRLRLTRWAIEGRLRRFRAKDRP